MQSTIHQLLDTRANDACTIQCEKNSFGRTWRMTSIKRWETVHHARLTANAKKKRYLQLFHASGTLESIAMDMLGPLPRTKHENVFLIVVRDGYSKMTKDIPTSKTNATHVAIVLLYHWVFSIGIRKHFLTGNGPQFLSALFALLCGFLRLIHLKETVYHLHTNWQL